MLFIASIHAVTSYSHSRVKGVFSFEAHTHTVQSTVLPNIYSKACTIHTRQNIVYVRMRTHHPTKIHPTDEFANISTPSLATSRHHQQQQQHEHGKQSVGVVETSQTSCRLPKHTLHKHRRGCTIARQCCRNMYVHMCRRSATIQTLFKRICEHARNVNTDLTSRTHRHASDDDCFPCAVLRASRTVFTLIMHARIPGYIKTQHSRVIPCTQRTSF